MSNQFTGCACGAPTPARCICEDFDRVLAEAKPVSVLRDDGRWIDPEALLTLLREVNPDRNTSPQITGGVEA